jgi:hypothetical protein
VAALEVHDRLVQILANLAEFVLFRLDVEHSCLLSLAFLHGRLVLIVRTNGPVSKGG